MLFNSSVSLLICLFNHGIYCWKRKLKFSAIIGDFSVFPFHSVNFPFMYFKGLFLGDNTFGCYVSSSTDLFISLSCSSLFLVVFLLLKSTLSDIHRVSPAFLISIFMVCLFPSFCYYHPTAMYLMRCLIVNISLRLIFQIDSDSTYLSCVCDGMFGFRWTV